MKNNYEVISSNEEPKQKKNQITNKRHKRKIILLVLLIILALSLVLLIKYNKTSNQESDFIQSNNNNKNKSIYENISDKDYIVYNTYFHNTSYFTEGFFINNNNEIIESTGLYGKSKMIKYNLLESLIQTPSENIFNSQSKLNNTSLILQTNLNQKYFGEGSCVYHSKILQLTYKERKIIIYSLDFHIENEIDLPNEIVEGWGMTSNGDEIYISDSTTTIKVITLDLEKSIIKVVGHINVHDINNNQYPNINELEYIPNGLFKGRLFANNWLTNMILLINVSTGLIEKVYDLSKIVTYENKFNPNKDSLNGIAYNSLSQRFYITGKLYCLIYEVDFL